MGARRGNTASSCGNPFLPHLPVCFRASEGNEEAAWLVSLGRSHLPQHTHMGTETCCCYRGVVASAVGAGGKVLGDSGSGQHRVEVEPRVRERMSQERRAFGKGRQSRPALWSRLIKGRWDQEEQLEKGQEGWE